MVVTEPAVPSKRLLGLGSSCILATSSACSTKIWHDSCRVFVSIKPKLSKPRKGSAESLTTCKYILFKHISIECYSFFLHQKQGASIVLDPEKDKSMVQDLLDFKEQLDSIIEDAFMRSEKFVNSMKVRTSLLPHCVCTLVYCPIMLQRTCRLLPYIAGSMSPYLSLEGQMTSVIKLFLSTVS